MAIAPVALLTAREDRAARQRAALARFGKPLLSITVVMPGPVKDGSLSRSVMELALQEVDQLVCARHWRVLSRDVSWHGSGPEALYSLNVDAQVLKALAIDLEEQHPIGRLWDLDVIAPGGVGLSRRDLGKPPRPCLLCNRPAHECGRSRRHPLPELLKAVRQMVHSAVCKLVSDYAYEALLSELMLTPKPGLVDRRNSGAHRDMDIASFLTSARVLLKYFPRFVQIGWDAMDVATSDFLALARSIGVPCEQEMFEATRGINTHKGAIFALGLLCSASGRLAANGTELTRERICAEVADICAGLVNRELDDTRSAHTAGERAFHRYGVAGARGEAASGYWTVRSVALPVYDRFRETGIGEELALLESLLHLLMVNADTNLISRGGLAGLEYVRQYARRLLLEGGVLATGGIENIVAFDDELIARNLSPGGSADLLIVTAFLARFPKGDRPYPTDDAIA
jgi:triphosphoribosyl-dephospho-CoA synthase CitG/holo-ACP synthase CitX